MSPLRVRKGTSSADFAQAKPNWSANHTVFAYGGTINYSGFGLDFDAYPKIKLYVIPATYSLFFDTGISQDGWFHVAATYDGNVTRAFVNGVEKKTLTVGTLATASSSLFVGNA